MNTYRLFKVSHRGPTDTMGARVIIRDRWRGQIRTLKYQYDGRADPIEQAADYLEKCGINIVGMTCDNGGKFHNILISEDFMTPMDLPAKEPKQ